MEQALIEYLAEFHSTRDYFECHEILEERWKEDPKEKRESCWVALIQIAVGLYHWRRDNFSGAHKMLTRALEKTRKEAEKLTQMGIGVAGVVKQLNEQLIAINDKQPYKSINLVLTNELKATYTSYCQSKQVVPFQESDMNDHYLLNKHTLRKR